MMLLLWKREVEEVEDSAEDEEEGGCMEGIAEGGTTGAPEEKE